MIECEVAGGDYIFQRVAFGTSRRRSDEQAHKGWICSHVEDVGEHGQVCLAIEIPSANKYGGFEP